MGKHDYFLTRKAFKRWMKVSKKSDNAAKILDQYNKLELTFGHDQQMMIVDDHVVTLSPPCTSSVESVEVADLTVSNRALDIDSQIATRVDIVDTYTRAIEVGTKITDTGLAAMWNTLMKVDITEILKVNTGVFSQNLDDDAQPKELHWSDYLAEKNVHHVDYAMLIKFGRIVADQYKKERDKEPPKREKRVNGANMMINSYSSEDREILDAAWHIFETQMTK